jgi:hypothetical protein
MNLVILILSCFIADGFNFDMTGGIFINLIGNACGRLATAARRKM